MTIFSNMLNYNICFGRGIVLLLAFGALKLVISEEIVYDFLIPNVTQKTNDDYVCTTWKLPNFKKMFVNGFQPFIDPKKQNVQQILLSGCSDEQDAKSFWYDCSKMCQSEQVLYAWGKSIETVTLPHDVAFEVFGDSTIKYLKLEVHYSNYTATQDQTGIRINLTSNPREFVAGVVTMATKPRNKHPNASIQIGYASCRVDNDVELYPFAFSASAHSPEHTVSSYIKKGEEWIKVGRINSTLPQNIYRVDSNITISKGDYLVSTCIYKLHDKDTDMHAEVCNFYLWYSKKFDSALPPLMCSDDAFSEVSSKIPLEARTLSHDEGDSSHHDHTISHDHGKEENKDSTSKGKFFKIKMTNVTTHDEDTYMCIDWSPPFKGKHFITGFQAFPDDPNVHHMLLFACSGSPNKLGRGGLCDADCGPGLIYFAWARNAPPMNLPKDVGFVIGGEGIDYLQLQVHYRTAVSKPDQTQLFLTITSTQLPNSAGVLLMSAYGLSIPAHAERVVGNVSCLFNDDATLHPFAFRTHAHMLGKVITGYVVHDSKWTNIGKGNPNWPQAFWPVTNYDVVIRKGDYLAAKCVYSSLDHNVDVRIGSTHNDEMCNFYIMYYQLSGEPRPTIACYEDRYPAISAKAPAEATELLPPNTALDSLGEGHKSGHNHHHHSPGSDVVMANISLPPVGNWPNLPSDFQFGQISGIAIDDTFVYVLHRGRTVWDDQSFNFDEVYQKKNDGPIREKVLVVLNSSTGVPVNFWGSNFFYMPHGLHVKDKSAWITDVATHQVFKFHLTSEQSGEIPKPLITLGREFEPGSDDHHFCKPTDVVTNLTGYVFVADGYCNNRIVVFDRFGSFVTSWSLGSNHGLPHSISIDDILGVIYVAGRLTAAIWVFDSSGKAMKQIRHDDFKPELFAISYQAAKDRLFCVNGHISPDDSHRIEAFHVMVVDPSQEKILSKWDLPHLHNPLSSPHDIEISPDGGFIVVAILDNYGKVLKFDSASSNDFGLKGESAKKLGVTYHRRPIGKISNDNHGLDQIENRKYKLTLIFIVVLCLFVLPLSAIVGMAVYVKKRRRQHNGYSHLEAAQQVNRRYNGKSTGEVVKTFLTGKASIPETIREEELKRLESESEEEFSVQNFRAGQI